MTMHTTRLKRANGTSRANGHGHKLSPRIAITLSEDDFRRLTWLADKRGVPVAAVLRDAVWAYMIPITPEADAAVRPHKNSG